MSEDAPYIGLFDLFRIGIGPSSSHTVGPMRAASDFVQRAKWMIDSSGEWRITCVLYGSLAYTGIGHCTDVAIVLGLSGEAPETVDPDAVPAIVSRVRQTQLIEVVPQTYLIFDPDRDIEFRKGEFLPEHPNGLTLTLWRRESMMMSETYFSVGGGFIEVRGRSSNSGNVQAHFPYPFTSAKELLELGARTRLSIAQLVRANEISLRSEHEVEAHIDAIWTSMQSCVERGLRREGILPGALRVKRRAPSMFRALVERDRKDQGDPMRGIDWVSVYALAVNEENAAGGRIVTGPTNGAAGIIPAVLHYYDRFVTGSNPGSLTIFLLTATAIGSIIKRNASISGADVGCQGEVGSAAAMAAAGLAAALGGSNAQVENAAEIALEHSLGLTCDPVAGLVQIPCIERNAIAAGKAINAARLALYGDGTHRVALDQAIETMRQTGRDMMQKYKETSLGGLAVNVPEC